MRSARRRWRQAGAVTAELVVATPLLLLLISLIVQYALFEHAEHVAQSAAEDSVEGVAAIGTMQCQRGDPLGHVDH